MHCNAIKLPNNTYKEGYTNFVYLEFPWPNAQISARSKENKEEKILATNKIKNENREITELFEQAEISKKLTNKKVIKYNARRNFRKHAAIRQTLFAQIRPSGELRIAAETLSEIKSPRQD
ncbi:hypothetical protein AciM339_0617 [Aciduliprofundum sp. MAR08-339]|uniref:hypothetical protein n=1 Tax=Aciduliprofundum sp. (strain MAR08-339) TaxID=673860 RepID=UPI0002A4C99D|nr:hypothetical protein AciM339_0617 [Aciduliprofundum sp. MAR08-339]